MNKQELVRRYCLFLCAVFIGSVGVVLNTKVDLGLSSISCFSYVSSVFFPITMGSVTILMHSLTLCGQIIIFGLAESKKRWFFLVLQIPAVVVAGLIVDLLLFFLRDFEFSSLSYIWRYLIFALGLWLIAINVALQKIAAVTQLSGDAFVILLAEKIQKKLGIVKLYFDCSFVLVAVIISLVATNFTEVVGVREGTVIGAIAVGPLVQICLPYLRFCEKFL